MHELSIAQSIIEIVEEKTKSNMNKKVKLVHLKVGRLSNILLDSLNFGFETLIQDTNLNDAKLVIEEVPVVIACNDCGINSEVKGLSFFCPECKSNKIKMISGDELFVTKIELE